MNRSLMVGLSLALAVFGAGACATTPVATGSANTTQSARKQLEGKWTMVTMIVNSPDGKRVLPDASGDLTVDEFSNLKIEYRLTDVGRRALETVGMRSPNPVISAEGRVAVDPQRHTVTYMAPDANARALDADAAALRANPLALEHLRYYTVGSNGILTLTTKFENGKEATRTTWKRATQ
jgi:hypothetical protein